METIHLRNTVSSLELQLADATKEGNEKVCKLEEELRKLHASFERNELSRQKLELQLTISQKESNQLRENAANKENQLGEDKRLLEENLKKRCDEFENDRRKYEEERNILKSQLNNLESENHSLTQLVTSLKNTNNSLHDEHKKDQMQLQELLMNIDDLESKCQVLQEQKHQHTSTIDHLIKEKDACMKEKQILIEKGNNLSTELSSLQGKFEIDQVKLKEANFNMEVLQLQVQDIEKKLFDVEKVKEEYIEKYEASNTKVKELEMKLSDSQSVLKQVEDVTNQYISQLTDNSQVVSQLTKEHKNEKEKNLELEKKLSMVSDKASKQESLIKQFDGIANEIYSKYFVNHDSEKKKSCGDQILTCFNVMEEKLTTFSKKNEDLKEEVCALKERCENYERALQQSKDSEQAYQLNVNNAQIICEKMEKELRQKEMDAEKAVEFAKNIAKKNLFNILVGIKKLLENDEKYIDSEESDNEKLELADLSISILKSIHEKKREIRNLSLKNDSLTREITALQKEVENQASLMLQVKAQNEKLIKQSEENINDVAQMIKEEKEKTKQKYSSELKRKQAEYQKSNTSKENIINKLKKENLSKTHELEEVKKRFKLQYDKDILQWKAIILFLRQTLLTVLNKFRCLLQQKTLLLAWVKKLSNFKYNMNDILMLLSETEQTENKRQVFGVLRFRVIVITVIASLRFCSCYKKQKSRKLIQIDSNFNENKSSKTIEMINWNECANMKRYFNSTLESVMKLKDQPSTYPDISNINNCFAKDYDRYMQKIRKKQAYSSSSQFLFGYIQGSNILMPTSYQNCEYIASSFHEAILRFTKRLHESEVERQDLREAHDKFNTERMELIKCVEHFKEEVTHVKNKKDQLSAKLASMESELLNKPSNDEFTSACKDLREALHREEELQELFHEQSTQIEEMNKSIGRLELDLKEKETELGETLNDLLLARQQQSKLEKELQRINKINYSKDETISKIHRDTELLIRFSSDVNSLFVRRSSLSDEVIHDVKMLLNEYGVSNDALHISSYQVETVKEIMIHLGNAFNKLLQKISNIRAEKHAMKSKMMTLENDINAHRKHVSRLKQQITEVCQQELP